MSYQIVLKPIVGNDKRVILVNTEQGEKIKRVMEKKSIQFLNIGEETINTNLILAVLACADPLKSNDDIPKITEGEYKKPSQKFMNEWKNEMIKKYPWLQKND